MHIIVTKVSICRYSLTIFMFHLRGGNDMPKTKFQDVIFTIMMVIIMVYAMVIFNISLDMGGLTNQIFAMALEELVIMGIAAFLLEFFIAGPLSKKLAFRIVDPAKDHEFLVILVISAITVCLMCPLMSFIASALFKGFDIQIISVWLQTSCLNFPVALCWQIFFAGPCIRFIFRKLFPQERYKKEVA